MRVFGAFVRTLLVTLPCHVTSYSTGAPSQVCSTLEPGHGVGGREHSDLPYKLTLSEGDEDSIAISITGAGFLTSKQFKGFIIQMRTVSGGDVTGKFHINNDDEKIKYLTCENDQDTITHSSGDLKSSVSVMWTPDVGHEDDDVQAVWSVVEDYSNYWVGMRSEVMNMKRRREKSLSSSSTQTASSSSPTISPAKKLKPLKTKHPIYQGCDLNKTCFGLPSSCDDLADCDLLASWRLLSPEVTRLELYSGLGGRGTYAALGLSRDNRMGGDLVIACVSHEGRVSAELSWNDGRTNTPINENYGNLQLVSGSDEDGRLYCEVNIDNHIEGRPPAPGSPLFIYELDRRQYHILVSGGRLTERGHLSYHGPGLASASEDRVDLGELQHVHSQVDLFMKCHAMVMVTVWLGCAGSGIILARYYKHTWRDADWCGGAQWFIWHRLLMMLVWAGTIAGVVLIFLDIGGWPYSLMFIMTNPHPVLGLAALALTFIQPFIALCRPHQTSPLRWIFNWCHWFVGNCAHVIAILAIFFAIELEVAGLERMVTWVVVSFVGFHVVTHTVLTINMCWSDHTTRESSSPVSQIYPMSGGSHHRYADTAEFYIKDRRGGGCRKFCFGLYFIVTWSVVAMVLLMIWMAPRKLLSGVHHSHSHLHNGDDLTHDVETLDAAH